MTVGIDVRWETTTRLSRTTLTTHVWTAPPLRRGSPIHARAFGALRDLRADLVRFLPWFSHPRLSVAQLNPPTAQSTHWNFGLLDPFVEDVMSAAAGRPVVANFATIPAWMFTDPVAVPEDPDTIVWDYERGTELRDPTMSEVADYFYRVASWYIAGGFTDEHGQWHESGHHHRFAYWEVLCEPDMRGMSPQTYTALFDAVVDRLRPLDPEMKFVGLSLTHKHQNPEYFWTFLDPANHRHGTAPDAMSLHFYAHPEIVDPLRPEPNAPESHWRDIYFAQADGFVEQVRLIDWETGKPNARYDALAYLLRHFGPGDAVVPTITGRQGHPDPRVHAQGFITPDGTRKLLIINKTGAPITVTAPDSGSVELAPYEVRVLLPND